MNPFALGLILLGVTLQIAAIAMFAILSEALQLLPLILAVSVGSALELTGLLMLIRDRQ